MNTLVLLIVTMGSSNFISYNGYGGVSVTSIPNMAACYEAKIVVEEQIKNTDNLSFDDNEIIVSCKEIAQND